MTETKSDMLDTGGIDINADIPEIDVDADIGNGGGDVTIDVDIDTTDAVVDVSNDAVDSDDGNGDPDVQHPPVLTGMRCSGKNHIVDISLENLDVDARGMVFFVPCPKCNSPVYIIDADVATAYELSKDDVKKMRSRMVNEKRKTAPTDLLMQGVRPDYNPQDADAHAHVDVNTMVHDDIDKDTPTNESPPGATNLPRSEKLAEKLSSAEKTPGEIVIAVRRATPHDDDDEQYVNNGDDVMTKTTNGYEDVEFDIPMRPRHVIAPRNDVMNDDGDPSNDIDMDQEIEPNELLKSIVESSKIEKKIKQHLCEDIDLEPGGWQPLAVSALLQSYAIPQATANKIAKLYEALLTKENRKRQLRETRSQMIGRPSGNFNLYNEYQNPGLFTTMGMMPGTGVGMPINTSLLSQQIAGLMGNVQGNPVMITLLPQLNQIVQQMNSLQVPNAPVNIQQGLQQVYPLVSTMVNYMDSMNRMNYALTPQDSMMLMQSMGQIQQTLSNLSFQLQEEQRNTSHTRYERYDPEAVDRFSRLAALRRRRLLEDDDYPPRKKPSEINEMRDMFNQMMQIMMQQQMTQNLVTPQSALSPVESELKQMRELVLTVLNEKKEREKEESLQEIREMKELVYNLLQQQQSGQSRENSPDVTAILLEMMRMQMNANTNVDKGENSVMPIILEMIRNQGGKNQSDDVKELRQFMMDVFRQSSQSDQSVKPDPRDLQQQELFNRLLTHALEENKSNPQYEQILSMLVNEVRDLRKTNGQRGSMMLPTTPMSSDELKYNLEVERFRGEMDMKKREFEEKRENRNFIREMVDNSFRQIGESVGALLTSGALNTLSRGGAGVPGTSMLQQQIQPYVNTDGNVMAFQCQNCGNAIYAPYGAHAAVCPHCQSNYVLTPTPDEPVAPSTISPTPFNNPVTPTITPDMTGVAMGGDDPGLEYSHSTNLWDMTNVSNRSRGAAPQVVVNDSPVVDKKEVSLGVRTQPPTFETRPLNSNIEVRKISDLPPADDRVPETPPAVDSSGITSGSDIKAEVEIKSKSNAEATLGTKATKAQKLKVQKSPTKPRATKGRTKSKSDDKVDDSSNSAKGVSKEVK